MNFFYKASPIELAAWLAIRSRPLLISIALIFSPGALTATADGTLTLESAVKLTLAQNPQLQAFDFRDEALQGQL